MKLNTEAIGAAFMNLSVAANRSLAAPLANLTACLSRIKTILDQATSPEVDVRPAHCTNIMTLLAHLCDLDDELRLWVLRWIAYPLRNPGSKMSTALVFNGGPESGKTLFAHFVLGQVYGGRVAKIRPRDLHSSFNGWVEGASLAVVDGEFARSHFARIKVAMTAESFTVHRLAHTDKVLPNHLNFVYVSDREDFLPADIADRRFAVIEVPPARPRSFYQAVVHEIADGGAEAFRDYLMHGLDMGTFNESTLPPSALYSARRAA